MIIFLRFQAICRSFACLVLLSAYLLPAHAELWARDLDGNDTTVEAYFDDQLNLTWLADANWAKTSGDDSDGALSWQDAMKWADQLQIQGIDGWRLPSMTDLGPLGCDFSFTATDCGYNVNTSSSEIAALFYNTLNNQAEFTPTGYFQGGYGYPNPGPFSNWNYQGNLFWFGRENTADPAQAWFFSTGNGMQNLALKDQELRAWAVRSGDVAWVTAVPEPSAPWMLLSGLVVLATIGQRYKQR
jgi:hypothetical protein